MSSIDIVIRWGLSDIPVSVPIGLRGAMNGFATLRCCGVFGYQAVGLDKLYTFDCLRPVKKLW